VGVKDIVIVDTPDALLVTNSTNAQRVKSIVESIRAMGANEVL
jgi:mannose-1-phosphate guanylyltransferase